MPVKRFRNRERRIRRREERNLFRGKLLPIAWGLSSLGMIGLFVVIVEYFAYGEWLSQLVGLSVMLTFFPILLIIISWVRGHSSRELEEP